ncbi:MAG TPA: MFS transporter, partial [Opitutaceae bacterium]
TANAESLGGISPRQWKSGAAAWLGWLFDGLELHLYTLVATPLVIHLLGAASSADPRVKQRSACIQAAFLAGWALGGAFFGRLGDRIGRSRALSLTILTYALCTGLCAASQTWWQLMIFRFLAALGIGGEWDVGACLLAETWPTRWRPWMAAVLQTGAILGIIIAAGVVSLFSLLPHPPSERWVFLIGVAPAFLVFWIRRQVPESEAWSRASTLKEAKPGLGDLFRGDVAKTTLHTTVVCALSLSGWWLFQFWHPQHLRRLLELSGKSPAEVTFSVSTAFLFLNVLAIVGNFAAGGLARLIGNRRAITIMFGGMFLSMAGGFAVPRGFAELAWFWLPMVGFFSGVFALFTMYLPPLFPTLLRTTGAGFCYNIGRLAAAAASLIFGWFAPVGDYRLALLAASGLVLAATAWALKLPADAE